MALKSVEIGCSVKERLRDMVVLETVRDAGSAHFHRHSPGPASTPSVTAVLVVCISDGSPQLLVFLQAARNLREEGLLH